MAVRSPGISGLAVGIATAGGVLLYSAIKNASVADTLRALIKGQAVVGSSAGSLAESQALIKAIPKQSVGENLTPVGGTEIGAKVAADVQRYLGIPYRFGGADPSGFDCSGLVTWVLGHDFGLNLPSSKHTVTGEWYTWSGARSVDRNSCSPGDLVCWPSHIGIAIDNGHMVHAPHTGTVVQKATIWNTPPPVIRRPIAYGSNVPTGQLGSGTGVNP